MREEMDEFENYCLAYGVQGKRWTSEDPWMYRRYRSLDDTNGMITDSEREMEEKINRLRDVVRTPVIRMQKTEACGNCYANVRSRLLIFRRTGRSEEVEELRIRAEESGDFLFATDHEQVWEEVMSLLDTFVEMLGEEKMSLSMFTDVMSTGLEALQFANIPPSLDQVLVANIDLSLIKCESNLHYRRK